jgi:hypothetical protein
MRKFKVICEWEGDVSMDADELVVYADSKDSAITKAKKKWRLTIGSQWPDARLGGVFILTPARLAKSI